MIPRFLAWETKEITDRNERVSRGDDLGEKEVQFCNAAVSAFCTNRTPNS